MTTSPDVLIPDFTHQNLDENFLIANSNLSLQTTPLSLIDSFVTKSKSSSKHRGYYNKKSKKMQKKNVSLDFS